MGFSDIFKRKPPAEQAQARVDGLQPFSFSVHPGNADQHISREIRQNGIWEPFETLLIQRLAPRFDVFLDLGANIGWYTALAQRLMRPGGEIHAFEPDDRNFQLLKANAAETGRISTRLSRMAVSDKVGTASLYRSEANLGDHRLNASDPDRNAIEVPVTTLDAYFAGRNLPPLLAKIDTQGSEPSILRGASRVLSPDARENVVILEFWPTVIESSGESVDAFIERLAGLTDTPFRINHLTRTLQAGSWDHFARRAKNDLMPMKLFFDLLLVRPGSRAMAAIEDLVSSEREGESDHPLHI